MGWKSDGTSHVYRRRCVHEAMVRPGRFVGEMEFVPTVRASHPRLIRDILKVVGHTNLVGDRNFGGAEFDGQLEGSVG